MTEHPSDFQGIACDVTSHTRATRTRTRASVKGKKRHTSASTSTQRACYLACVGGKGRRRGNVTVRCTVLGEVVGPLLLPLVEGRIAINQRRDRTSGAAARLALLFCSLASAPTRHLLSSERGKKGHHELSLLHLQRAMRCSLTLLSACGRLGVENGPHAHLLIRDADTSKGGVGSHSSSAPPRIKHCRDAQGEGGEDGDWVKKGRGMYLRIHWGGALHEQSRDGAVRQGLAAERRTWIGRCAHSKTSARGHEGTKISLDALLEPCEEDIAQG